MKTIPKLFQTIVQLSYIATLSESESKIKSSVINTRLAGLKVAGVDLGAHASVDGAVGAVAGLGRVVAVAGSSLPSTSASHRTTRICRPLAPVSVWNCIIVWVWASQPYFKLVCKMQKLNHYRSKLWIIQLLQMAIRIIVKSFKI